MHSGLRSREAGFDSRAKDFLSRAPPDLTDPNATLQSVDLQAQIQVSERPPVDASLWQKSDGA
jgi:hypothetical protein